MKRRLPYIIIILLAVVAASCTNTRYLADDEHALYRQVVDINMADSSSVPPEVSAALKKSKNYMLQKPNSRLLMFGRVGMYIYNWASPNDSTFWGNYWRRIGQATVPYDENKARRSAQQLQQLLESKGCFGSKVTFDTLDIKTQRRKRDITIGYHISAKQRYVIDEVLYRTDNSTIAKMLDEWRSDSPLHEGDYYDQEVLAAERARIASNLRESGYFHASGDNISFLVDTTYHSGHLSIEVVVDGTGLKVYHINNINIFPNSTANLREEPRQFDTLIYTYPGATRRIDIQYIYDRPMTIRPQTISRSLAVFPGMTYRPRYIANTYTSLLGLRTFKYINIEFVESPSSTDTLPLVDANIRLINATMQRLSLSLEVTNASPLGSSDSSSFLSGGNLGLQTSIEYQHKNLFGGAELLRVKSSMLIELPKLIFRRSGSGFYDNFSAFEADLEMSLDIPAFLLPFANGIRFYRTKPHTLISLGGSYQYRYYYERILANTSFGYTWRWNKNIAHQLLPVEMTFVRILNLDPNFLARLNQLSDLRLKYQYSSHFILDGRYDYTYSNQQYGTRNNFSVLHLSFESAGNLLAGIGRVAGIETDSNGVRQILGVPYAQYVRLGTEWTRYHYIGTRSSLVARLLIGVGLPYGNSISMPYEKSFFGGGPTTMRAWQLRHLGPGAYYGSEDMLERVGDLQLVLNLEGRFPIAGIFEGAVFADMGNVWLLNSSEQYPGGEIKWNSIPTEVAVGVGLGLRVSVSIATLRLDLGIPLYDPGYATSHRFRPPHWRFNQIVTNFGINYPF